MKKESFFPMDSIQMRKKDRVLKDYLRELYPSAFSKKEILKKYDAKKTVVEIGRLTNKLGVKAIKVGQSFNPKGDEILKSFFEFSEMEIQKLNFYERTCKGNLIFIPEKRIWQNINKKFRAEKQFVCLSFIDEMGLVLTNFDKYFQNDDYLIFRFDFHDINTKLGNIEMNRHFLTESFVTKERNYL